MEPPRGYGVAFGPLGGGAVACGVSVGRVVGRGVASLVGHDVVDEAVQRPVSNDRRIELPDRPGGRVPGIRKGFLAVFDALAVVLAEAVFSHEHLAANRQQLGSVAAESLRDRPNAAGLCGHVVPFLSVAAGGCASEAAVRIDEFDRDAVEFGFTDIADPLGVEPFITEESGGAIGELPHVGGVAALGDREHRRGVFDRLKIVDRFAADAVGRAVGIAEIEFGFERFEPSEEFVVDAVGDQRLVIDVVAVVVFADRGSELLDLVFGFVAREGVDRFEFG